MTSDKSAPTWRNGLTWAAMAFVVLGLLMAGAVALLGDGGLASAVRSGATLATLAAGLALSTAIVGFSQRRRPFNVRNARNFIVWSGLAVGIVTLLRWGLGALAGEVSPRALGVSATVALGLGLALLFFAVLGFTLTAAAHARSSLLSATQIEGLRDMGRAPIYSWTAVAAMGLTLILLSLAGRSLSPPVALAGVLVLLGVRVAATFATWPLLDEFSRTLSRESGNASFYLVVIIGGGWAILAQLGFAPPPAPLDWLTLLTVIMFAASFIAVGRRGLLQTR